MNEKEIFESKLSLKQKFHIKRLLRFENFGKIMLELEQSCNETEVSQNLLRKKTESYNPEIKRTKQWPE